MRAARVEEVNALAIQIAKDITRRSARSLNKLQSSSDMKEVWAKVRQLTKRRDDVSQQSCTPHQTDNEKT